MSSNSEDEFGDCLLDDSDLLTIDIDADHLSNWHSDGTAVLPAAAEIEGTSRTSFPSNDIVNNSTNDRTAVDLRKQQNSVIKNSTASGMATKHMKQSSPTNPYQKRFKAADGETSSSKSNTIKDNIQTATATTTIPSNQSQKFEQKMKESLFKLFGYDKFRKGQLEVLHSIIEQRRDCAVFWATGSGKSLCYQLPALYCYYNNINVNERNKVAIVVSPLISLMQDQCNKLNGIFCPRTVAVYLGSSQRDTSVERRALVDGEFPLVFLTPEKICSGNVLDQVELLSLSVIAIDEAHCVSEWGHDFRKEYRQLCRIRSRKMLSDVPILTLTGTATPRVRQDIISSLLLRNPLVQVYSNDRDNLRLEVHRKPKNGGFKIALQQSLIREVNKQCGGDTLQSTIIYAPTIKAVEEISHWLSAQLPNLRILPYHSKLTEDQREAAHIGFLVGHVSVVVATIAFGMGIDKTDTRRIIHYGPPKTMEEYVQQIGRAGRDGRTAYCIMYADHSDFSNYESDFYVGKLSAEARANTLNSLKRLQNFAMTNKCRRAELLRYFSEDPPFGDHCGTCDNCITRRDPASLRNFSKESSVILLAVNALSSPSLTIVEKVLSGKIVESHRYKRDADPTSVKKSVEDAQKDQKYSIQILKELIPPLATYGYLVVGSKSAKTGQYKSTWTTYDTTIKGTKHISDPLSIVQMPIPSGIKMLEEEAEKKRLALISTLKDSGVDLATIPTKEIEAGDGDVIKSYKFWITHLENLKKRGKHEWIGKLQDLHNLIERWRLSAANKFKMAPADVMPEHLIAKVAYTSATSQVPMTEEILGAVGVRSGAIVELAMVIQEWAHMNASIANASDKQVGLVRNMIIRNGEIFSPSQPWPLARIPMTKKNGKLAPWESSYTRFMKGEQPQSIAVTAIGGKPIQVRTVVGHILDALTFGKPVALDRLAAASPLPTSEAWTTLQQLESSGGPEMDVEKNEVKMSDMLAPLMGEEFMQTPYQERREEDSSKYSTWCDILRIYMAFRRAGYIPCFEDD